jgi:signal transduction histidine kinase
MFQIHAKNSCINLSIQDDNPPDCLIQLLGDAAKLSQVLRNLVSNAMKFTPSGGSVIVKLHRVDSANKIKLEVKDTGPGMTKENRMKLFNEVVQFDPATLQSGQGSGLGLYLTRRIVDLHGGRIRVDLDWEGPGSIFYLELEALEVTYREKVDIPPTSLVCKLLSNTSLKSYVII